MDAAQILEMVSSSTVGDSLHNGFMSRMREMEREAIWQRSGVPLNNPYSRQTEEYSRYFGRPDDTYLNRSMIATDINYPSIPSVTVSRQAGISIANLPLPEMPVYRSTYETTVGLQSSPYADALSYYDKNKASRQELSTKSVEEYLETHTLRSTIHIVDSIESRNRVLSVDTSVWEKHQPKEVEEVRADLRKLFDAMPLERRDDFRTYLIEKIDKGLVAGMRYNNPSATYENASVCFKGHLVNFYYGDNKHMHTQVELVTLGLTANGSSNSIVESLLVGCAFNGQTPENNTLMAWFKKEIEALDIPKMPAEMEDKEYNKVVAEKIIEMAANDVERQKKLERVRNLTQMIEASTYSGFAQALMQLVHV